MPDATFASGFFMALILALESATAVCSVALIRDGKVLSVRETNEGFRHAELMAVYINEVMRDAGMHLASVDALAVSGGPGSYTGLRIGVSTAKGICWALEKPLIAVPTLMAMAYGALVSVPPQIGSPLLCPMIDARRMEVYCAVYTPSLIEQMAVSAKVIEPDSFHDLLSEHVVYFFGDGMAKCKPYLSRHPNARFIDDLKASAVNFSGPAEEFHANGMFESVALYEPFYLKEFIAGKGSVLPPRES